MKKKKIEFSQLILLFMTTMVVILTIFGCYMMWKLNNLTALPYIIGGWFAELGTATGFYYNKAKAENKIKIPLYMNNQLNENIDNSNKEMGC